MTKILPGFEYELSGLWLTHAIPKKIDCKSSCRQVAGTLVECSSLHSDKLLAKAPLRSSHSASYPDSDAFCTNVCPTHAKTHLLQRPRVELWLRKFEVEFLEWTGEGSFYRPLTCCSIYRSTTDYPHFRQLLPCAFGAGDTTHHASRQKGLFKKGCWKSLVLKAMIFAYFDSPHGTTGQGKHAADQMEPCPRIAKYFLPFYKP